MNAFTLTLTVNTPELAKKLIDIAAGSSPVPPIIITPHIAQTVTPAPVPPQVAQVAPPPAIPINPAYAPGTPTPQPAAPAPSVPVAPTPSYTIADLQKACAPLMDAGREQELVGLIHSFGAQFLTQIPKERLGEFATALRGMGAQI